MQIGILDAPDRLSDLIVEHFSAWGAALTALIPRDQAATLSHTATPVLIVPAHVHDCDDALIQFAERGGIVIAILPGEKLLRAAGVESLGPRDTPTALRWSNFLPGGFRGETCPIIGEAVIFKIPDEKAALVNPLAHLAHPTRFAEKSPAWTHTAVGTGALICLAFDLPRCVLYMRQGDPALTEVVPPGDACSRPSHMGSTFEAGEAAWMPFADLLARALVELSIQSLPGPCPLFNHLPGTASGLLLYSGDEDNSAVAATNEELDFLTAHNARMDLYIIPDHTPSTLADTQHFARHHDLGPHPNLRPLDGAPVAERLALLESQIKLFTQKFGVEPLTVRNHCTAWAGYMEHVEVLERCGAKMDASYFAGRYGRGFDSSPYGAFGGAMPVRFCRPDGKMLGVYQQHTAISDDVYFAPDRPEFGARYYSFNMPPQTAAVVMQRYLHDAAQLYHVPATVNLHPGNWVVFSRDAGQSIIHIANQLGVPIWSFTQWCRYWLARATWRIVGLSWSSPTLSFSLSGTPTPSPLCFALPTQTAGRALTQVSLDGRPVTGVNVTRYRQSVTLIALPADVSSVRVEAVY